MTRAARTLSRAPSPILSESASPDLRRLQAQLEDIQNQLNEAYRIAYVASTELLLSGDFARRPTAGVQDRIFWATDQAAGYYDDGTDWKPLSGLAGVIVEPTYAASITFDASLGDIFVVHVTNGVAFTIENPINVSETKMLVVTIVNDSGGVMGAITWNTDWHLAGAFVNPGNGKNRSLIFAQAGGPSTWYELTRTAADVTN